MLDTQPKCMGVCFKVHSDFDTIVSELVKNILKTSKSPSLESIDNQIYTP